MKHWLSLAALICFGSIPVLAADAPAAADIVPVVTTPLPAAMVTDIVPVVTTPLPTVSGTAVEAPAPLPTVSGTAVEAPTIVPPPSGHYFRLLDPHHLVVSLGTLYDLHGVAPLTYITDVALITHSTADGSIIPAAWQRLGIQAEDWVPLQVGAGGSAKVSGGHLSGNALVAFGTAGNVCPLVLGWAVNNIGASAPLGFQIAKAAITGDGSTYPKVRLGYVFQGQAIKDGVFQSVKEAFPGRGALGILNQAGRFEMSVVKRL